MTQLSLFGEDLTPLAKPRKKRRKKRPLKKRRVKQQQVSQLDLWSWRVAYALEGEAADCMRNLIRDFFRAKNLTGEDWTEEQLFAFAKDQCPAMPIICFQEFFRKARESKKGKLQWIRVYENIPPDAWSNYLKLIHAHNNYDCTARKLSYHGRN